ncbi:MAG: hypothetical protein U9R28_00110 [Pseudomonadota bacterium]|nr:hypothetical protein [Pseudomonadota bacterium]
MNSQDNAVSHSLIRQLFFTVSLVLILIIGLSAASWYVITEEQKEIQKVESQKIKELNSLRSQVEFLRSQVKLYYLYGDKYKDLVRQGIVKKQDRVFWVDSIVQMQKSLVMPDFTFKFSPEAALSSERFSNIKIDKNIFYFSRLDLNMAIQHDGDLLTFLEAINERISPLYLVESCQSAMLNEKLEDNEVMNFDPEKGNIKVQCSLIVFHSHSKEAI